MCCSSYPTGNTIRHIGQLCSSPPPSVLELACTSSTALSSTTSSLFPSTLCRELRLSDTFILFVRICLLTVPDCGSACSLPFLPSCLPTSEHPGDDAASSQLRRDGLVFSVKLWRVVVLTSWLCLLWDDCCLSGGSGTGLVCTDRSCWEVLSLRGSELELEGGVGSGKGETSSLRSHQRCSSNFRAFDF